MKYRVKAKVDQVVTREIVLEVIAKDEEEAQDKAREAIGEYPEKVHVEGMSSILVTKQHFWIPKSIEFQPIKSMKETR